ncbi:MAG: glycosyltransferase [Planctomycetota bacterium]|nr:glycosyltransferase [Planctomycetota bacterium]MDG1985795.1 glycosyltransferase [Planctomycetota bacterium]
MRVALVCKQFRSSVPVDLGSHALGLALALARTGLAVEVFTLETCGRPRLTSRRRCVPVKGSGGPLAVTAIAVDGTETPAELAAAFGSFLERERPTVCHFESIASFGAAVISVAKDYGLPTVYCARDPWPAHDQLTLTLPDLTPFELGDCAAEARGEVARELCPSIPAEGVAPTDPAERGLLRALLDGDDAALKARPELAASVAAARERIDETQAHKRAALSLVDRRFAATRMLARQLSAAVGRGFTSRLPGVEPTAARLEGGPEGPSEARMVFMGSSRPVEGLDLLLDAMREVLATPGQSAPQLHVTLEATERARDAALEARATSLGVSFECGSGPVDVASALGNADVLVHPARWGQFAPAPVRLAQAAGLPVVVTAIPGIEELVDPASSVLVAPGEVGALAEALVTLADRAQRLGDLRGAALRRAVSEAGVGSFKDLDVEADEWRQTYEQLVAAAPARPTMSGPPHVAEFIAELNEVRQASVGELFGRVEAGLEQLRSAFALPEGTSELIARAVARGGPLGDQASGALGGDGAASRSSGAGPGEGSDLLPRPSPGGPRPLPAPTAVAGTELRTPQAEEPAERATSRGGVEA